MEAAHYVVENIFPYFFPLLIAPVVLVMGIRLGRKIIALFADEQFWSDEKPKNDDLFAYEDDKPKRLVLNEDGEIENWES